MRKVDANMVFIVIVCIVEFVIENATEVLMISSHCVARFYISRALHIPLDPEYARVYFRTRSRALPVCSGLLFSKNGVIVRTE